MDKYFGLHFLLQTYLGIASNVVEPGKREERKSIGSERWVFSEFVYASVLNFYSTFHTLGEKEKIMAKLEEVAAELEEDMERTGWTGKIVTLKYKLDNFQGAPLLAALVCDSDQHMVLVSIHSRQVVRQMDLDEKGGFVCSTAFC